MSQWEDHCKADFFFFSKQSKRLGTELYKKGQNISVLNFSLAGYSYFAINASLFIKVNDFLSKFPFSQLWVSKCRLCITDDLQCSHNSIAYSQNKQQSQTQQVIKDFTKEKIEIPKEKRGRIVSKPPSFSLKTMFGSGFKRQSALEWTLNCPQLVELCNGRHINPCSH